MSRDTSAPAGSCGQQLGPRSPTREEEGCRELEHGRDGWNQNSQEQRAAQTLPRGRLHPRLCTCQPRREGPAPQPSGQRGED